MTRARDRIEETLFNLKAEGVPTVLIGTLDVPDLTEAARQINWSDKPWLMPICAGVRRARGAASTCHNAIAEMKTGIAYADDNQGREAEGVMRRL